MTLDVVNYLVDLLTAKNHLGIESADVSSDSSVILWINGVSQWFKNKTRRQLRQSAVIEYRDGNDLDEMYTNQWPISSSVEIYIDTANQYTADTLVPASSVLYNLDDGLMTLLGYTFTKGTKAVKLIYSGGYADIPADLQMAALLMIDKLKNPQAAGLASISVAGGTTMFLDAVAPKFVLDVIERYEKKL